MKGVMFTFTACFVVSVSLLLAVQYYVYPMAATSLDPDRIEAPAFLIEHLAGAVALVSATLVIISIGGHYILKFRQQAFLKNR